MTVEVANEEDTVRGRGSQWLRVSLMIETQESQCIFDKVNEEVTICGIALGGRAEEAMVKESLEMSSDLS
jgi:hypothetical protein